MSFTISTLDISTNSPEFVVLSGREFTKNYTPLPNQNLPKQLRDNLSKFYTVLTGESEFPLEDNTFLIKAYEGAYTRMFGPVLKVGNPEVEGLEESQFYIQWGNRFIPVSFQPGKFFANGSEVDAEFGEFDFSGRGQDVALLLSIDDDNGGQMVLPIAVRFSDWDNPIEANVLNKLFKKTPDQLLSLIQKATTNKGSGRLEATHEVDFKVLEVKRHYEVVGYYPCKTSYGLSYRIFIKDYPEPDAIGCAWAHSSLRPLLSAKPEITVDKPAVLVLQSKELLDTGKVRIRSSLFLSQQQHGDESALNLDF